MPQTWFELARDARKAASRLAQENFRSCLNRAYYAAFSRVTHELNRVSAVNFPRGREGPSHPGESGTGGIHKLIVTSMPDMEMDARIKLSELVGRLYTLRIYADYMPSVNVEGRDAREAISIMNTVFDSF
jgi:uncharacterized protein (UPF0332 family)